MAKTTSDDHRDPDLVAVQEGHAAASELTRPAGLDRDRILTAAIGFIDENGLSALTMRRLGATLGVEAMALYRYVPGREDLLDGVVDRVVETLFDKDDGDDIYVEDHNGWQDYLMRLAHGVRRIALAHPSVFPLVASRPPAAPWVRPPLRSLRMVESFLGTLTEAGFPDQAAVAAYRAYSSFLLGHLLLEVTQIGAQVSLLDQPEGDPEAQANTDLTQFPALLRTEALLSLDKSAAEFEEALENLLDRLERVLHEAKNSDGDVSDLA
ncbi:TetR/AcrR family transcriptional regulator C-terminal domain-containing protein [Modestobacter sp. VKM Ac-2986]|uniref:TetR/AcrR family transcriptional regulator C-terminal domain-containing protein n=1 Tax=Modestobacter sp. VKM Ac-2986 TaxID=3004140 RepID=UPI0022ABBF01|nr:TetR/AcrR family transcriptional regulator C-terminal domain-containing protein [Modestobacter sp. VKM Ac-2986]MCZ2830727.1 TetR/AcrR family transcriptional regulator C-terminal domain-containing protein [Modestobacter sp. VKM Ac-2986]